MFELIRTKYFSDTWEKKFEILRSCQGLIIKDSSTFYR